MNRPVDDEPLYSPKAKPPSRQPQPGERLFEFLRGHDRFLCELRDHGEFGVEAQFFINEEFLLSRRFETRASTHARGPLRNAWVT